MTKENKFLLTVAILFALLISIPAAAYVYQRATYASKYAIVATQQQEEDVATIVSFSTSTAATNNNYAGIQLVDVSNVNMYPHPWSGEIRVSRIELTWQATAAASTTIMIGTVASTSVPGLSDVHYFDVVSFDNSIGAGVLSVNPYQRVVLDYSPSLMKLGNKDSATERLISHNATTTGFIMNPVFEDLATTIFATSSVARFSPLGTNDARAVFGSGDLVAKVLSQVGTASTTIRTFYHVK